MTRFALSALLACATALEAGSVRAHVNVHRAAGSGGDNANVVLWLTPVEGEGPRPKPEVPNPKLVQKNKQFEPHLLVIPVGTSVEFPNKDPYFHNVFSLYKGKRFDLGLYEAGTSRTVRFDRPGVSFIFCNIHPEMSAAVLAMNTPWYAVSNAAGDINIPDVPDGHYRMEVWSEQATPESVSALNREVSVNGDTSLGTLQILQAPPAPHKDKYGKDYDKNTRPY
jgi:hypothetical protein